MEIQQLSKTGDIEYVMRRLLYTVYYRSITQSFAGLLARVFPFKDSDANDRLIARRMERQFHFRMPILDYRYL